MEYPEVAKRLGKKININYYLKSIIRLCAHFINYDDKYQPSSESLLESLGKSKDGKALDEDKISNKRNALVQKLAKNWVKRHIKDLRSGPKKDEAIISHLWSEVGMLISPSLPSVQNQSSTVLQIASPRDV